MKIKRFKLKENTTKEDLLKYGFHEGGTWVHKQATLVLSKTVTVKLEVKRRNKSRTLNYDFEIDIVFTDDIQKWNDVDNVMILDSDYCQPYYPFYDFMNGELSSIPNVLPLLVDEYNKYMSGFDFLEEIK